MGATYLKVLLGIKRYTKLLLFILFASATACTKLSVNDSDEASGSGTVKVEPDTTATTLTINRADGQAASTSSLPILFTIVLSEAPDATTFTTADITQSGTATGIQLSQLCSIQEIRRLQLAPSLEGIDLIPFRKPTYWIRFVQQSNI